MTERLFFDRPAPSTRTAAIVVIAVGCFFAAGVPMALISSFVDPRPPSPARLVAVGAAALLTASLFVLSGWSLRRRRAWAWLSSLILLAAFALGAGWLGIAGATEPEGDGQVYAALGAIEAIAAGLFGVVQLLRRETRADIRQGPLSGRILPLPSREARPPPPHAQN